MSPFEGALSPHVRSPGASVHQPGDNNNGNASNGVPLKHPKAGGAHLRPGDMERKLVADGMMKGNDTNGVRSYYVVFSLSKLKTTFSCTST